MEMESNEELTGQIRKLNTEIERGDLKGLIVGRSESHQEIDTQIDRLAGGFRKKGSSEELGEMLPGDEYLERRPTPKVSGKDGK